MVSRYSFTELNRCLNVPQALGINNMGNKSIVAATKNYLEVFCSSATPDCPEETLQNTTAALKEHCGTPPTGGFLGITMMLVYHYDMMRPILCTKNQTTNAFCSMDALETIERGTQKPFNQQYIWDILNGVEGRMVELGKVFATGRLCTGCASALLYNARLMGYVGEWEDSQVIKVIQGICGAGFGGGSGC